jgi:DNA phosphorothioation-associated putative methyltransferase
MGSVSESMHQRGRTAIGRGELSRPLKLAINSGLVTSGTSLFDYGCGRGDDLRRLDALGFAASGWDPVHRPETPRKTASVVNLGYVVNVIEDPAERAQALKGAWNLAGDVLIVSARTTMDGRFLTERTPFSDGLMTARDTFQKFFEQSELRSWIDETLGVASVPAAPGIFYVFRDESRRASFMATRYRRRLAVPRQKHAEALYTAHETLLAPLMEFMSERGRLPVAGELPGEQAMTEALGSVRRAFRVIARATDDKSWEDVAAARKQDLLIYLALLRFDIRPQFTKLPVGLQADIKAFFGTYKSACASADEQLFSLGDPAVIEGAFRDAATGKLTPSAFYVHVSALDQLPATLRMLEGCARGYIGEVEEANLIKFHRDEPKISYLSYPAFDTDPHPALSESLSVHLQTFRVRTRFYADRANPPVLHRKETFVARGYPQYAKFARLTRLEEQKGVLDETSRIGTRDGWNAVLTAHGLRLKGHRLVADQAPFQGRQ